MNSNILDMYINEQDFMADIEEDFSRMILSRSADYDMNYDYIEYLIGDSEMEEYFG